jgi:hypothetical protein
MLEGRLPDSQINAALRTYPFSPFQTDQSLLGVFSDVSRYMNKEWEKKKRVSFSAT